MIVWILEQGCVFEGGNVVAIYSTLVKAQQAASLLRNERCNRYKDEASVSTSHSQEGANYWIEHWTCDGITYSNEYIAIVETEVL